MSSPGFRVGETIAAKYRIESVLGRGAMGVVVAAWHTGLQQRVAIKLMASALMQTDRTARERFLREARLAARIRSEHVCRVLDTGALDDGTPFLVMEYLKGTDLAAELASRGRFEPREAVTYLCQACSALSVAHAAGVVHRDLKPANLFLVVNDDGTRVLKVLDFGVSKALAGSEAHQIGLTQTATVIGSPIYMSPEQLDSSKNVDPRTDIWALGTILYELITGRTPFRGDSVPQLVNAVLNSEPPSFASLGVTAPNGLEVVIARALSKSTTRRFASANELHTALMAFATDTAASASRDLRDAKVSLPGPSSSQHGAKLMDTRRGWMTWAALGLIVSALIGTWVWQRDRDSTPAVRVETQPAAATAEPTSASARSAPPAEKPAFAESTAAEPAAITGTKPSDETLAPQEAATPPQATSATQPPAAADGTKPMRTAQPNAAAGGAKSTPATPAWKTNPSQQPTTEKPRVPVKAPQDDGLPAFGGRS